MGKFKLNLTSSTKQVDPNKIFDQLTLRGNMKNIWEPQADALRRWHDKRESSDVVVEMNTGGGKTLVGLLIAQSLMHELERRVVYVVPNNQLVEQTRNRAKEVGIQTSARYKGQWHEKSEFESARQICITNYAALFNGRSLFVDLDVQACVFDDAHVAETMLHENYTLAVPPRCDAFNELVQLFRPHFANDHSGTKLDAIVNGEPNILLFIPMFVVWKRGEQIRQIFEKHDLVSEDNGFPWQHIKDRLKYCSVIFSADGVEITPAVIPRHTLPYFDNTVRRVYLTATTPSDASFIKTFGVSDYEVVRPSGRSGDAQRLFLFAPGATDEVHIDTVKEKLKGRKSCVIAPSVRKLERWEPEVDIFKKSDGQSKIDDFAEQETGMLGLAGRYDGIDLPGDACRILVVNHLPKGESLLDRFLDETMRVQTIRTEHAATRIVQAIGRIFRSNTDHGVVYLAGSTLHNWIRNPANTCYLPRLLQQQLQLGIELDKLITKGEQDADSLIQSVLDGDADWDASYNEYIAQMPVQSEVTLPTWFPRAIATEQRAFADLWDGKFESAAELYDEAFAIASDHDEVLAAWFEHFKGLCYLAARDDDQAFEAFDRAAKVKVTFGRYLHRRDNVMSLKKPDTIGFQAPVIAALYRTKRTQSQRNIKFIEDNLKYQDNTKATEDAFQRLGILLGVRSNRPDNENQTGVDNLWCDKDAITVFGFDLKTGKEATSRYTKTEIAISLSHHQWLKDNFPNAEIHQSIVGRTLSVERKASPSADLQVIDISDFQRVAESVKDLYERLDSVAKPDLESTVEMWLQYYGLVFPNLVVAMSSHRTIDLLED